MRKVIAIAAPVGGGKSSLAAALAHALDAPMLCYDDYETATHRSVAELQDWLALGADFERLEAPGLVEQLAQLRAADSGSHDSWVVFEMPLGRAWSPTAAFIDVLVWLDVPADIALARKLRELAAAARLDQPDGAREALRWLDDYLGHYLTTVHRVLDVQRQRVPADADLVLDGRGATGDLLQQVLAGLEARP